ncbi:hypothetical protein F8M41_017543 [Gigaspora margarita]|uniref:Uncharacterized protein n=1 Tax=Gigaspora margarita TaxID=4874 RepID=A0A8H3WRZ5_GIGMA|nr:hypothetical protein F8M41_017544 [Gigaspora margarita]KAF0333016.1 hypothetical protein F8M41_017543 [Gigaspora margarita]
MADGTKHKLLKLNSSNKSKEKCIAAHNYSETKRDWSRKTIPRRGSKIGVKVINTIHPSKNEPSGKRISNDNPINTEKREMTMIFVQP